jgi:hypothetical protein
MTTENAIRALAGTLVLTSFALAHLASPKWLFLSGFVGVNLSQSAFTGFCPAEKILRRLGLTKDACCARPEDRS